MNSSAISIITVFTLISLGVSCSAKKGGPPMHDMDAHRSETNKSPIPLEAENEQSPSSRPSLREQLMGPNEDLSIAVFSDEDGLLAIDELGSVTRFSSEAFEWLTIDYDLDVMWMDRLGAPDSGSGLFILDLAVPSPSVVKVTWLTKLFEIRTLGSRVLPMTEGNLPYRISMSSTSMLHIDAVPGLHQCGIECNPSEEASRILSAAVARSALDSRRFTIERFPNPTAEQLRPGAVIDIPGFSVKLRSSAYPANEGFGWQLYDPETKEYISHYTFERSLKPLPMDTVTHLMVCRGGRTLVVRNAFFNNEFQRLDSGGNRAMGICLSGGLLFEDGTKRSFEPQDR
jgi:hypothetical protein